MATTVLTPSPRVVRGALVSAFFTVLAVVNSYPLALSLDSAIGQHGDAFFSVWRLAWVAHQLRTDPARLFDANIFYPESTTLAYSDAMLLPALVVAPLAWMGVSPLVVYNVTLLGAFVASGVAAYALVRRLTDHTAAGLLAGVIFAYSPHRLEHFDHLELQFAFWIPLAALLWHRAVERDGAADYLKVSAVIAGQILSSIYHGIFLVTWVAAITAVWFLRTPRKAVRAGALLLLPALLVLAVYSLPYLDSREAVGERSRTEVSGYSAVPTDFLSAPSSSLLYGWTSDWGANERRLFPGLVALLLGIAGAWRTRDARIRIHAAGLGLALVLALGFNGGLYTLLYDWVLPYRGMRVPARAGILILLGTAVLAGAGLARILPRLPTARARRVLVSLVLAAASIEYLASPQLIDVDRRTSEWYRWLRSMPDAVVFEWPVTVPWRLHIMEDVRYMYRSIDHWRPLLNGYSGNYPRSYLELLIEMRSFPYTPALDYLRRRGATVIVVHENPDSRPSFEDVVERLHRDPNVSVIAQSRDSGARVLFFRLLPGTVARHTPCAQP